MFYTTRTVVFEHIESAMIALRPFVFQNEMLIIIFIVITFYNEF